MNPDAFRIRFPTGTKGLSHTLTEHGVELLGVQVPLAPRSLVAFRLGVVGVVKLRFCPERVQDPQHAPKTHTGTHERGLADICKR